jgi:hypothetical protein
MESTSKVDSILIFKGEKMSLASESKHKDQIKQIIKKINQSWLEGHPENLNQYFDDDIMIVSPEFKIMGAGKAVCVKSYADFISQAVIKDYQESDPEIHVWANTAVAFYEFEMAWEMGGKSFKESGRDFFVFAHENDRWLTVWRMMFSSPQK